MQPTVVSNVVGLTARMVGPNTPNLQRLVARGGMRVLGTVTPAVTCSAQATFLTGVLPNQHGIVGNGWYFRDLSEIWFWRQSAALVGDEKLWDAARARHPGFTCANMFWWSNMYSGADIGVTRRLIYCADGRKLPDCCAAPAELRDELTQLLGSFRLFSFWGPATTITSSEWIARASIHVRKTRKPTLTLTYLPHLDYGLQRVGREGPSITTDLRAVDNVCGELIANAEQDGARIIVLRIRNHGRKSPDPYQPRATRCWAAGDSGRARPRTSRSRGVAGFRGRRPSDRACLCGQSRAHRRGEGAARKTAGG